MDKQQKFLNIWTKAARQFDTIIDAVQDERRQCLEDRRFYSIAGAQWEGDLEEQFENKPQIEVNKIHLAVIRIINEYRNNRITVDFESDTNEDLAELCNGLFRFDENRSSAQEAYDNGFEEAVGGGFGALRLSSEYQDEFDPDDDAQNISIEPIYDADTSVYFDLDAKKQDKSDSRFCFVLTSMTHEAYEEQFNESPTSWDKNLYNTIYDWCEPDVVYVAEYFVVEEKKEKIHFWEMPDGTVEKLKHEEHIEKYEKMVAFGGEEIRTKNVKKRKIRKYILSGGGILDDCGYIFGKYIPIVPIYGKRWFVDNIERCMGHVRLAKDAQRLKNIQLSKLAEISTMSSVEKPILLAEQVKGIENYWANDNIENYAFMLLNPITDANGQKLVSGPLGYTKPPVIPPALAALLQITEQDINDILGNQQNGEQIAGNVSTQTAELIQTRLDMQTYIYLSNMAKAVKRVGEIWLDMAKEIYTEKNRVMRTRTQANEVNKVELMKPKLNEKGEVVVENNLQNADFDVVANVGPSSSTKKSATVRQLLNMLQVATDPVTQKVLSSMIMMNMEGEGVGEVRDYFRKELIKMKVIKPSEEEEKELQIEMQNEQPTAQDQYLLSAAEAEKARAVKAQSDATKIQADALLQDARTDKTRTETIQILEGMENDKIKQNLEIVEKLGKNITPNEIEGQPLRD